MNTIAEQLYQKVEEGENPARHTQNGLTLTLKRVDAPNGYIWTLSLTRRFRQATDEEREKAKTAFKVPKDADWQPLYKEGWGIIRYTWLEECSKQMQFDLPGLGGDREFNNWEEKFEN